MLLNFHMDDYQLGTSHACRTGEGHTTQQPCRPAQS
jgi:hypothetical protein